ncbi:hypothetical protein VP01_2597g1 [Puccinia sorghi]|uniref:Uncharacterized protein n=1 Tax=Puccinia sorghi TaxID=27349 RepID=A0A0L6V4P2_9BASI|nr:hypothetical protein VP01_2597g1 [Puccinia sorghi]
MQKVPGSFCCYSNHSPKSIQPIFDAQSLCILHSDCFKKSTYANMWGLEGSLPGACCMSQRAEELLLSLYSLIEIFFLSFYFNLHSNDSILKWVLLCCRLLCFQSINYILMDLPHCFAINCDILFHIELKNVRNNHLFYIINEGKYMIILYYNWISLCIYNYFSLLYFDADLLTLILLKFYTYFIKTHQSLPKHLQFTSIHTYRLDKTNIQYTYNQTYGNTSLMAHARQLPKMFPLCMERKKKKWKNCSSTISSVSDRKHKCLHLLFLINWFRSPDVHSVEFRIALCPFFLPSVAPWKFCTDVLGQRHLTPLGKCLVSNSGLVRKSGNFRVPGKAFIFSQVVRATPSNYGTQQETFHVESSAAKVAVDLLASFPVRQKYNMTVVVFLKYSMSHSQFTVLLEKIEFSIIFNALDFKSFSSQKKCILIGKQMIENVVPIIWKWFFGSHSLVLKFCFLFFDPFESSKSPSPNYLITLNLNLNGSPLDPISSGINCSLSKFWRLNKFQYVSITEHQKSAKKCEMVTPSGRYPGSLLADCHRVVCDNDDSAYDRCLHRFGWMCFEFWLYQACTTKHPASFYLMHSNCAYCTVTVPKNQHMQTCGVWMAAWLEYAACQLFLSDFLSALEILQTNKYIKYFKSYLYSERGDFCWISIIIQSQLYTIIL